MESIEVSICCLAYNHEKYIRKCLDGFVNQKCNFKFEVLIHDDASTDSTAEIIREYQARFPNIIKPIFQKENKFSKGEKVDIKYNYPRAKGKYIALCEGDDYWFDENKLQKQYDIMQQYSDCGVCLHKVLGINEAGERIPRTYPENVKIKEGYFSGDYLVKYVCIGKYLFQTSSYFVKTELVKKYCLEYPDFSKVAVTGDTPLLLYLANLSNAYYLNEAMSCYRLGSSTSKEYSKSFRSNRENYRKRYNHQVDMIKHYDTYTNGKYHKYCKQKIDSYYFNEAWEFNDFKGMCKLRYLKFYKINKFSLKARLKIFLCAYFSAFIKF